MPTHPSQVTASASSVQEPHGHRGFCSPLFVCLTANAEMALTAVWFFPQAFGCMTLHLMQKISTGGQLMQWQCINVVLFVPVAAAAKCLQGTLPLGKQEPLLPVCSFELSLLKALASKFFSWVLLHYNWCKDALHCSACCSACYSAQKLAFIKLTKDQLANARQNFHARCKGCLLPACSVCALGCEAMLGSTLGPPCGSL